MKNAVRWSGVLAVLLTGTVVWSQSAAGTMHSDLDRSGDLLQVLRKPSIVPGARLLKGTGVLIKTEAAAHIDKFDTVDYPGASGSETLAKADGITLGLAQYSISSGEFAFVYKGGVYSTFTVPGSSATVPLGVNGLGVIVGGYADETGMVHGFADKAGTFTDVDFPGANATIVYDINKAGDMGGIWRDSAGSVHGFIDQGGAFTSIDVPGAVGTNVTGINAANEVVGTFTDSSHVQHGFMLKGTLFSLLDVPLSTSTTVYGVNNAGQISGSFSDASTAPRTVSSIPKEFSIR